jgi:xanthine phosphoribosyltransferase
MDKLIITNKQMSGLVNNICRQISTDGWRPDYIVGITRGGLIPAVMISHWFNLPMQTLKVSLRDGADNCESNLWMAEDAFGYSAEPKNILIVDDINDSGNTINWIIKDWQSGCLPNDQRWKNVWNNNVRFAVLVDNLVSECTVGMDYFGLEINKKEKDVWVEFPYENWWA